MNGMVKAVRSRSVEDSECIIAESGSVNVCLLLGFDGVSWVYCGEGVGVVFVVGFVVVCDG